MRGKGHPRNSPPSLAAAFLLLALSSPFLLANHLASATCDSVKLVNRDWQEDGDGHYQIGPLVDCTSKPPEQHCKVSSSSSDDYTSILHPTFNSTVSDPRSFLQLFYDAIPDKQSITNVDLNTTAVSRLGGGERYDFTMRGGRSGYVKFTPFYTCWDGVLGGCGSSTDDDDDDDDDAGLEGKTLRVCGPEMYVGMTNPMDEWRFDGVVGLKIIGEPGDDPTPKIIDSDDDDDDGAGEAKEGLATNDVGDYVASGDDDKEGGAAAAASVLPRTWYGALGLGVLVSAVVL